MEQNLKAEMVPVRGDPEQEFASLVDAITKWVNDQIRQEFWRETALTPIKLAQDLLPLKNQPRKLIKELDRLIEPGKYFS